MIVMVVVVVRVVYEELMRRAMVMVLVLVLLMVMTMIMIIVVMIIVVMIIIKRLSKRYSNDPSYQILNTPLQHHITVSNHKKQKIKTTKSKPYHELNSMHNVRTSWNICKYVM